MIYEPVIGLEVHVQLKTRTKAFCGCANEYGAPENTHACPVCLGLPGTLPVLNANALKSAIKVALALGGTVRNFIKFDRKNYFYPDLPKNFQISQYDMPLSEHGFLEIEAAGKKRSVRIKRVHLEEDAGKLIHPEGSSFSLVDYNRAGTPLLEIVSEADLYSPEEAYEYLSDLKLILEYLDVSDCDMEKGSLRCDANISLRPKGESKLGTKAELKNMNSFKAVKVALEYEIKRQTAVLEDGGSVVQETRLWDEKKQESLSMRSKEEAHDYRYFPEPDLPPFIFSDVQIEDIRRGLPELPAARHKRFMEIFGLSAQDATTLIADKALSDFFESCLKIFPEPKKIANWLMGPLSYEMNSRKMSISALGLKPEHMVRLIKKVEDGTVSNLVGKDILAAMLETHQDPEAIIMEKNLGQVSGADQLQGIIGEAIAKNPKSVEDYRAGKQNALMFLVGQVMKISAGKANPKMAKELITERLKSS